jgi:hypothetical protein
MSENNEQSNGTANADGTVTPPANPPEQTTTPLTPPAQSEPQRNSDDNSQRQHASNREVIAAVESLPEKIVNAIREAVVPPSAPAPAKQENSGTNNDKNNEQQPGKNSGTLGERFNKFWWGTK